MNTPAQIAAMTEEIGVYKANQKVRKLAILAIFGGLFIGLGAMGASVAAHAIESVAAQKMISAVVFPTGLIMLLLCGAELFTGDCLAAIACIQKKISWLKFFKLLTLVWLFNFIGGAIAAGLTFLTPQWNMNGGLLGAYVIKLAADKTAIALAPAFVSGILCNVMVCLAIWAAAAAKDATGKIFACFFPLVVFVLSGFEHCVANMYYITAGLLAKTNPAYVAVAMDALHASPEKLEGLTIANFLIRLIPVTLGNIVGGSAFIGAMYTWEYLK